MSPRVARIALVLIVAGAMLVSARWALLVPILQSPDETTQLDYVVSVYLKGGVLRVAEKPVIAVTQADPVVPTTQPLVWLLAARNELPRLRFHPDAHAPAGYGSAAFLERLQADAPRYAAPALRNPFYIDKNPFGYYALAGAWMTLLSHLNAGIVFLFYGTRLFSVLLLGGGLVLTYAITREAGWSQAKALAFTAAIGFFPLTSFVSSSVQPDNFTFAVLSLCLLLVLRLRRTRTPESPAAWLAAGIALGCLLITKYHLFAAIAPVVFLFILTLQLTRAPADRHWWRNGILLATPVVTAGLLQLLCVGAMSTQYHVQEAHRWQLASHWPASRWSQLLLAAQDFYGGRTFRTFWGVYGWGDTPLRIGSKQTTRHVWSAVEIGTRVAMALAIEAIFKIGWRVAVIARRRRWAQAARLAMADLWLVALLSYTALMFILFLTTPVAGEGQGRHWYALLPAIFALAVNVAPRASRNRRLRQIFAWGMLCVLLSFDAVAAPAALRSVSERYYGTANARGADAAWLVRQIGR